MKENFCFMEGAEQGSGSSKIPGRTMKGSGERHFTKSKRQSEVAAAEMIQVDDGKCNRRINLILSL